MLEQMSMAGPCGMLVVGPTIATTEVVEDVDGEPLGGAVGGSGSGYHFRRKASMVAPLGDATGRTDSRHKCLVVVVGADVIDGGPPGRQCRTQE
jgi:hypothetical protein